MDKSSKRFLSGLLALCMIISLCPAMVFAEEFTQGGTEIAPNDAILTGGESTDFGSVVSTYADLKAALTAGGTVKLGSAIEVPEEIQIPAGVTAVLDLAGYAITSGYQTNSTTKHLYPLNVFGNLTIKDSGKNGSISGRGIYVQVGSKLTVESGTIYGIDDNGGSALYQYGGDIVINGGLIEQTADYTYNYAIYAGGGTVTVNGGKIVGKHGALSVSGAAATVNDGELICSGNKGWTDNIVYVSAGSFTANGGEFIHKGLETKADSGAAVVAASADVTITITDGTFVGLNGAVSGNANTTVTGGSFACAMGHDAWDTLENYVPAGSVVTVNGETIIKNADGTTSAVAVTIDGVGYATLADAIAAAQDGNVITLVANIELADTVTIPAGKIITLDLNGKTISQTKAQTAGYQMILNDGNLTIQDSVGGGKISYTDSGNGGGYVSNTITNRGTLTLLSGTIENLSSATVANNGFPYAIDTSIWGPASEVVINIKGGTVTCASYSSMRIFAQSKTEAITINISGGTINGRIEVQNPSNKTTDDFVGVLNVTGGVINKNNSSMAVMIFGDGSSAKNLDVNISGGTFTGVIGYSSYFPVVGFDENAITGGNFDTDVSNFCALGFVCKQNSDGTYGVQLDPSKLYITNVEELKAFRDAVNAGNTFAGITVYLAADIDLAGEEWTPIGNATTSFDGVFDGQGYTISNLVINATGKSNIGFFGFTQNGEIKNLTIHNAKVTGRLNVGVVAGTPYTSKYTNIKVTGHVEVNGMAYVGGVAGKNAYANWTDVVVDVDATSYVNANSVENGNAYRTYVGGVIGFIGEGGHTFKNISTNIKVIGSTCDIGGVFGIAHYGNNFENITFTGSVEAPADAEEVGGIAGVWHNQIGYQVTFTNVTSTGTVKVGDVVTTGSIVGGAYNANNENASNSGSLIIDGKEAWLCVAKVGDIKFQTVLEAVQYAIDNNAAEVVILTDVREQMPTDIEWILNADLKITAPYAVELEFYNVGTKYDFVVNSNNNNTFTIGENVSLDLVDRVIWLGYYGNNVDVVVEGYLGGYQIWHGADTTVTSTGTLDSHGEAFIMRRNATLTVNGGNVNANYFHIYSGHIVAKDATINAGLVWIKNNHSYGSEGTVSWTLDNTTFVSRGVFEVEAGANKTITVAVLNGSTLTANGKLYLNAGATLKLDPTSVVTASSVTGDGKILIAAEGYKGSDAIVLNANMSNFVGAIEVIGKVEYTIDGKNLVISVRDGLLGTGTAEDPYLITDLEDLLWFQAKVDEQAADGSTQFAGKYFKLTADIDLAGINWNPIGSKSGDHASFKGVFDGNGHTIYNLHVEQAGEGLGLFAYTSGNAVIKNLNLHNVYVKSTNNSNYVGGLIGNAYASTKVENVHITGDVYISGRGYVGGIAGHGYVVMDNVSVIANEGGLITSTFWCAGGILGYAGEGTTNIMNAKVENLTITSAAGGLGAIVGMAEDNNGTQPISGSNLSAKNVEIKTYVGGYGTAYEDYAMGYLYGGNPSILTGTLTVENVSVTTASGNPATVVDAVASVNGVIYFDLQAAFAAAKSGDVVTILAGEYTTNLTVKEGITVVGQTDANGNNLVTINGKLSVSGDNVTVKNLNVKNPTGNAAYIGGKDVLIEGCNISGSNGFRSCYTSGKVTFKDSVITGSTYGIHFDGSAGGEIVIDNCVVTGWTSFAAAIKKVTMTNTTFAEGNYNYIRFYQEEIVIDGCHFNANMKIDLTEAGANATVTNSTYAGDKVENLFSGDDMVNANISVDGVKLVRVAYIEGGSYYKTLADAIAAAQDGDTVVLNQNASVTILLVPEHVTLDLNGYILDAKYVSCFGHIVDTSAANTGRLNVAKGRLLIQPTNAQLPVYDGTGYCFAEILRFNTGMYDGGFVFQTVFEENVLEQLKLGTSVTGVTIQVLVSWTTEQGVGTQKFVYVDDLLLKFLDGYNPSTGAYGGMFSLKLTGTENVSNLTFQAVVSSDLGVEFVSNPFVVK